MGKKKTAQNVTPTKFEGREGQRGWQAQLKMNVKTD